MHISRPLARSKQSGLARLISVRSQVESQLRVVGIRASDFGPQEKAAFASALTQSLAVDGEVYDIVATDVVRRRARRLLTNSVDVAYKLRVPVNDNETPVQETMIHFRVHFHT